MNAVIIVKRSKSEAENALNSVKAVLENNGCDVFVADKVGEAETAFPEGCGVCIVLGGDGTMLSVAEWASKTGTPLIGINLGTLGYMHELEDGETERINDFFTGKYRIEERMMLSACVRRNGETVFFATALNEIVVCRGVVARLIDLELSCDGIKAASYRADGLIIATPTGSTAYQMSAGGPIIDPSLEMITVCAVCPHGFFGSNPLIFAPAAKLGVSVSSKYHGDVFLTADGKNAAEVYSGDEILISRASTTIKFVRFKDNRFYEALAMKFNT